MKKEKEKSKREREREDKLWTRISIRIASSYPLSFFLAPRLCQSTILVRAAILPGLN